MKRKYKKPILSLLINSKIWKYLIFIQYISLIIFLTNKNISAQASLNWQKEYNTDSDVQGFRVIQIYSGGFVFIGLTSHGYYIVNVNSSGDTIWTKQYGDRIPYKIIQTLDSNFIIVGKASEDKGKFTDGFIQKLSKSGNQIWKKKYGNSLDDILTDVIELESSELLCSGGSVYQVNPDLSKMFLLKSDQEGNVRWIKYYDSTFSFGGEIEVINNNKILLSGYIPILVDFNGYIIRYSNTAFEGYGIYNENSNNIIFRWDVVDSLGFRKIQITKTDTTFNILSQTKLNLSRSVRSFDMINGNVGLVICGGFFTKQLGYGGFLLKIDDNCNVKSFKEFINKDRPINFVSLRKCNDSGYVTSGVIAPLGFGRDNLLATKTDSSFNTNLLNVNINENSFNILSNLKQNYPNPFNSSTTIEFELTKSSEVSLIITDLLGRIKKVVIREFLSSGNHKFIYSPKEDLSSGIYFFSLILHDNIKSLFQSRKFLYLK